MSEKLVAMTFEEASRWIASQERRIEQLEAALRKIRKGYNPHTLFGEIDAVLAQSGDTDVET